MTRVDRKPRIVIAVTETTPLRTLWRAAMNLLEDRPAELVTLFVEEDRWRRVASLPFTREVTRTGRVADFTLGRAEQVHREAIARVKKTIRGLAEEASVEPRFEVLAEADEKRLREFVGDKGNVLVAPEFISSRPLYTILSQLDCRILLVEATEQQEPSDSA